MTERGLVRYGNTTIPYTVTRSRRRKKTIEITLDASEGVLVAAPFAAPAEAIRDVVLKRAGWIIARANEGALAPNPKQFISGETLPYLGREVRLDVTHADVPGVRIRFSHWLFAVTVPARLNGDERRTAIRAAFVRWYRRRAGDSVRSAIERWSKVVGAAPTAVAVRDQRRRWGSCAPDGTLRFNWRIAMAEPELLDYVVVHELAHLVHRNHSREFWSLVELAMPDYPLRRKRLREAGPRLSV
ncbi:MAG: M48 family metallopeptidase [Dehalococcoidia bacterium]|nr:M48 family metallopeptidase [Dehalococcoidia bacterium]